MTVAAALTGHKTTSVPFHAAPLPVQAVFRFLERTMPALGARWAEWIWFTLPRASTVSTMRRRRPPGGMPFALDVDGHAVVGEVWGDGPAVYLVHGWAGHGGQLDAFVSPLVTRGHRVIVFDAPSHGRSAPGRFGPRSSTLPELASALSAVIAAHGPPSVVVAHSMGATAAATLVRGGLRAGRLIMLAPMASVTAYARRFVGAIGAGDRVHCRLVARIERRVQARLHQFEVPELSRTVALPPTLILHDREDATIPFTDAEAIAAAWPTALLRVTSGLGHRRLLSDPDTVAAVVDFVTD